MPARKANCTEQAILPAVSRKYIFNLGLILEQLTKIQLYRAK